MIYECTPRLFNTLYVLYSARSTSFSAMCRSFGIRKLRKFIRDKDILRPFHLRGLVNALISFASNHFPLVFLTMSPTRAPSILPCPKIVKNIKKRRLCYLLVKSYNVGSIFQGLLVYRLCQPILFCFGSQ